MMVVAMASPVLAIRPADHTVDWYRTHQQDRERVLSICQNDHSFDNTGDCRNAVAASHAALADSFLQESKASAEPEANPAYYGHNGPLIAMTLSMCSRHKAPQSWCQAAQSAQGSMLNGTQ